MKHVSNVHTGLLITIMMNLTIRSKGQDTGGVLKQ